MKQNVVSLVLLLAIVGLSINPIEASDDVDPALQQLHRETKNVSSADVRGLASRLKAILAKEDFSATPGAAMSIGMCGDIAQRLTLALKVDVSGFNAQDSELLDAVKQFMAKVAANLDDGWTFQRGTANVAPPDGVPNAVAGMNPDAISDPALSRQYLGRLEAEHAKKTKNNQQTALRSAREKVLWAAVGLLPSGGQPGWTPADLTKHFGKDEKSKAILNEYLRKAGRLE